MAVVAPVAHYVIGLDWGPAFVLGVIVSPTDAVAPAEIMRRVGAPRRMVTVVEGENLTNDWTALVLYRSPSPRWSRARSHCSRRVSSSS